MSVAWEAFSVSVECLSCVECLRYVTCVCEVMWMFCEAAVVHVMKGMTATHKVGRRTPLPHIHGQ